MIYYLIIIYKKKKKLSATKLQAKWREFKARKDKRLKEYIGKYYKNKQGQAPDAPPQPDPAQVQPGAEPGADPAAEPAVDDDYPIKSFFSKTTFQGGR